LEPWERVWIDAEAYRQDVHSYINCTDCHSGQSVEDMEDAHQGMDPAPAANAETCGKCHVDVTPASMNSLHTTLRGYDTALYERSSPANHPTIEAAEQNHCNRCHTTCGDCHISQPASVGGGLLKGHVVQRKPPMSQTCTGCHGSRVKNEYFGLNEEIPSDVHFRARMSCTDCHSGDTMHGINGTPNHRYDGKREPTCEGCHTAQVGVGSGIPEHEIHGTELLACQVCHSTSYINCVNCHVAKNDDNKPFFTVEDNFMALYIGHNPLRSTDRPYRYVLLRHAPADPDSLSFYGNALLDRFDTRSTWEYATPHNIQRRPPQAATCEACHGNAAVFLTEDKVLAQLRNANRSVIVRAIPTLPANYTPVALTPAPTQNSDGFWDIGGSPTVTPTAEDFWDAGSGSGPTATPTVDDFWGGGSTGPTPTPTDFWGN
jgi:thiosulfate/3-mercaptopyruvate sulfurtransferase